MGIEVEGPVLAWELEQGIPPIIKINPADNAVNWSEINVHAATKALKKGEVPDGYCQATIRLYCQAPSEECECVGATPTIVPSASEIAPGGSITMTVSSGELACPPFTWEVSDTGYSISGSPTSGDGEEVTLSCASGTCGTQYDPYCTVTVTDDCGLQDTQVIKNTGGQWVTCCAYEIINWGSAAGCFANCSGITTTGGSSIEYWHIMPRDCLMGISASCYESKGNWNCSGDHCPPAPYDDPCYQGPCTSSCSKPHNCWGDATHYTWSCPP